MNDENVSYKDQKIFTCDRDTYNKRDEYEYEYPLLLFGSMKHHSNMFPFISSAALIFCAPSPFFLSSRFFFFLVLSFLFLLLLFVHSFLRPRCLYFSLILTFICTPGGLSCTTWLRGSGGMGYSGGHLRLWSPHPALHYGR